MWHCTIPCRKSLLQLTYMQQFTNSCNMIYIYMYMYVLDAYAAYYIYIRRKVFKLVPRRERENVYIYIYIIYNMLAVYLGPEPTVWTLTLWPPVTSFASFVALWMEAVWNDPPTVLVYLSEHPLYCLANADFHHQLGRAEISLPPNCDDGLRRCLDVLGT